ncbi:unnamed protein product [Symbiodinium microadriaticum]|nr:unnamed protein product [Symbiodinium microadriaticum]
MVKKKGRAQGLVLSKTGGSSKTQVPKSKKQKQKQKLRKGQLKTKASASAKGPAKPKPEAVASEESGSEEEMSEDDVDPAEREDYMSRLIAFLKKNGKSHISRIGRNVDKPENLKIGKFLTMHAEVFKIDKSTGSISLS